MPARFTVSPHLFRAPGHVVGEFEVPVDLDGAGAERLKGWILEAM